MNASQTLRAMLATEGIFLDEQPAPVIATPSPTTCDLPIDRALVREILGDHGAPDRDLDWLVASCPSVEHALAFEPTPWMLRDIDDFGDHLETER
jgi:hypothetical protein